MSSASSLRMAQPDAKGMPAKTCIVANSENRNPRCPRRTPYRPRYRRRRPAHPPLDHVRAQPRRRISARLQLFAREQSGSPFAGGVSRGARRRHGSAVFFLRPRRGHGGGARPRTGRPYRGRRTTSIGDCAKSSANVFARAGIETTYADMTQPDGDARRHAARDAADLGGNPLESA